MLIHFAPMWVQKRRKTDTKQENKFGLNAYKIFTHRVGNVSRVKTFNGGEKMTELVT